MLLEKNVSGLRISCLVKLGQRALRRQTRKEFPKVASFDWEKKAGSDGLVGLGQVWRGE